MKTYTRQEWLKIIKQSVSLFCKEAHKQGRMNSNSEHDLELAIRGVLMGFRAVAASSQVSELDAALDDFWEVAGPMVQDKEWRHAGKH